ncbi:MAG: glycoside hydrolase family 38 C-terminal domain-containing protein [Minisyncoccales bacterium]
MTDKIYLVPHTHYDAVWVFTREDYFHINIDIILEKVVDLIARKKDYRFLIEQTYLLEEVKKHYPELFRKIKKYVNQGKIEIADGEYLMADTMLPQGETLVREIMVGKQFVKKEFDKDVEVMWQADSFGLNAQLPQIYKKSGYKYLAFRRGSSKNKPSEFIWQALDGTKIISHFMPLGYRAGLNLAKLDESYKKLKKLAATNNILMPSGSGVTMPQEETIKVVRIWNKNHRSRMEIATPLEFFKSLDKDIKKLPIRKGEMYSGRHSRVFPGALSSRIWLKIGLRDCENKLIAFEKFNLINSLFRNNYFKEIKSCWKRVLFLAFHDIVPGTGIDAGYKEVRDDIIFLNRKLPDLTSYVLDSIIKKDSNNEYYGDIAVFNSLSWDVSNWTEVILNFKQGEVLKINGVRSGKEEREVEIIELSRHQDRSFKKVKIGFIADVPATGYKVYQIITNNPKTVKDSFLKQQGDSIENKFFKVKFSKENGLIKVFKEGRQICQGNEIVIDDEAGDLYAHKESFDFSLKTESGQGLKYGAFKVKRLWVDSSCLRKIINIETDYYSLKWPYRLTDSLKPIIWRYPFIKFKKQIIIYKDIPRIDFTIKIENNHPKIRLRVRIDTDINELNYTCDTQFGVLKRKTDQCFLKRNGWSEEPSGLFPCLKWFDYSNKEKGITFINKGNSENEIRGKSMYLTLLRSIDMLSCDGMAGPIIPVSDARELKNYTFQYSIYPHSQNWKKAKCWKQGYEFNNDLVSFQIEEKKRCRTKNSFLKIKPDNIIASTLKKAEENKDIIVRFYEISGKNTKALITIFKKIKDVRIVNLMEKEEKGIDKKIILEENNIKLEIKPFEIITLKITLF